MEQPKPEPFTVRDAEHDKKLAIQDGYYELDRYYDTVFRGKTHRDDAMNLRCNSCEHIVRQCICDTREDDL